MLYKSTRSNDGLVTSSEAILKGLSDDGGLFVPTNIPKIDEGMENLINMDYKELALYIMKKYFTDFDDKELVNAIENSYGTKFEKENIVPIKEKGEAYFLELYHGPTLAFKDMALTILPHLLKKSKEKKGMSVTYLCSQKLISRSWTRQ